jgi:RluA family pseudouridine synthase
LSRKFIHFPKSILFEDDSVLVIDKPAGLMVEPDRNGHSNLLQEVKKYLKSKLTSEQELYAQHIHRLDRPVSGIVLFAKQRAVLKNLSEQFAERRVKKFYQAITDQVPILKSGVFEHWHRKEKKKAMLYEQEIEYAEKATLTYEVSELKADRFLWNIELHTGKYHQIRAQLANAGCPIIGDSLYGSTLPYHPNAIALHAYQLTFFHPISNEQIDIVSNPEF